VGASGEHERLEGLTASKRRSAGGGADAGAVLGDTMEIDEVVFHEPRQELGHELAEDVTIDPEPRRILGSVAGTPAISPRARTSA
jgi:hypothetical protein